MNNLNVEFMGEKTVEHNSHWSRIFDHLYRILTVGITGSGKTNVLPNLIYHQEKHIFFHSLFYVDVQCSSENL